MDNHIYSAERLEQIDPQRIVCSINGPSVKSPFLDFFFSKQYAVQEHRHSFEPNDAVDI